MTMMMMMMMMHDDDGVDDDDDQDGDDECGGDDDDDDDVVALFAVGATVTLAQVVSLVQHLAQVNLAQAGMFFGMGSSRKASWSG